MGMLHLPVKINSSDQYNPRSLWTLNEELFYITEKIGFIQNMHKKMNSWRWSTW
jgi:hypothetical protein